MVIYSSCFLVGIFSLKLVKEIIVFLAQMKGNEKTPKVCGYIVITLVTTVNMFT